MSEFYGYGQRVSTSPEDLEADTRDYGIAIIQHVYLKRGVCIHVRRIGVNREYGLRLIERYNRRCKVFLNRLDYVNI